MKRAAEVSLTEGRLNTIVKEVKDMMREGMKEWKM